ncbi:MAG: insulinase family protein, partial [Alphaproteobacteria bacterium]|nr:insulinase family protein [Alphaproteobacteria bacterium]
SALIDSAFADLPQKSAGQAVKSVIPATDLRRVMDIDVPQTALRFSLPGIPRHDPDFVPAVVLNHIFGGGSFSSRLFQEVREKRGLAYSVWSHLQNYDKAELLSGGTSTKNERAAESIQVIEEEIAKLLADGPSPDELEKAKKFMIGSYALRFDTSTKIAGNLVSLQVDGYRVEYLDQRNGLIAAVTMEDVNRAAKRLFAGRKLLVAAAGRPQGL